MFNKLRLWILEQQVKTIVASDSANEKQVSAPKKKAAKKQAPKKKAPVKKPVKKTVKKTTKKK
jgi:hypothetical protein